MTLEAPEALEVATAEAELEEVPDLEDAADDPDPDDETAVPAEVEAEPDAVDETTELALLDWYPKRETGKRFVDE